VRQGVWLPGLTDTPLASKITGNEGALKASVAMHPLGKIGCLPVYLYVLSVSVCVWRSVRLYLAGS
jgi:hypothetical protein